MRASIQGILFDSGDTLVHPTGKAWFPSPAFHAVLAANGLPDPPPNRLEPALDAGMRFLEAHPHLKNEEEERAQFEEYYGIVLAHLGPPYVERRLARDIVTAGQEHVGIKPFPEVPRVLESLRQRGLRLGVISNAWPSLERNYRALGLRQFFDAFVISARLGCLKPDPRIYHQVIEEIDLSATQLLFVDDWPDYVRAAIALGLSGIVMARSGQTPPDDLPWIANLEEIEPLLARNQLGCRPGR